MRYLLQRCLLFWAFLWRISRSGQTAAISSGESTQPAILPEPPTKRGTPGIGLKNKKRTGKANLLRSATRRK